MTGGYYADVEAECQLFHVCVQVSDYEVGEDFCIFFLYMYNYKPCFQYFLFFFFYFPPFLHLFSPLFPPLPIKKRCCHAVILLLLYRDPWSGRSCLSPPPPPQQMQSDVNRHKIVIKSERYTDMQCIKMHISDGGGGRGWGSFVLSSDQRILNNL